MADLSQLEMFVNVVDAGSFTGAAEALGVSKSHVSRQISALEDRLGARLLNRTTRKVILTDIGRVFHERCTRILEELEDAEAAVTSLQTSPRGRLRMSVPMSFGVRYIAPYLADFMAQYPELEVEVDFSDRRVDLVDDGYDLAIRIGRLADSSLIARKLAPTLQVVCASPGYLEEHGEPHTPEDLKQHQCLLYTYDTGGLQTWRLEGPGGEVVVHVKGRVVANNGDALVAAAEAGLGVLQIPDFLAASALRQGSLRQILPQWASSAAVWAVYPHSRHLSAKVRVFVDGMLERFQTPPWSMTPPERAPRSKGAKR